MVIASACAGWPVAPATSHQALAPASITTTSVVSADKSSPWQTHSAMAWAAAETSVTSVLFTQGRNSWETDMLNTARNCSTETISIKLLLTTETAATARSPNGAATSTPPMWTGATNNDSRKRRCTCPVADKSCGTR